MKKNISEAVKKIKSHINTRPRIGIILGSGLGSLICDMEDVLSIKFEDIPNFPLSTVKGHKGELVSGKCSGVDILVLSGRIHYYEGYTMKSVCFPVEVLADLGIEKIIVTNAAGGVNEEFSVGDIIVIKDHINLMGDNPLIGEPNFLSMTDAYSNDLRELAYKTAESIKMNLKEGIYLAMSGPSYETPAEVKMARILGADMVGMSTVPEVIVANSTGVKVLGISMISNMGAGLTGEPLSHEEVIESTHKAEEKFKTFIKKLVENM